MALTEDFPIPWLISYIPSIHQPNREQILDPVNHRYQRHAEKQTDLAYFTKHILEGQKVGPVDPLVVFQENDDSG